MTIPVRVDTIELLEVLTVNAVIWIIAALFLALYLLVQVADVIFAKRKTSQERPRSVNVHVTVNQSAARQARANVLEDIKRRQEAQRKARRESIARRYYHDHTR